MLNLNRLGFSNKKDKMIKISNSSSFKWMQYQKSVCNSVHHIYIYTNIFIYAYIISMKYVLCAVKTSSEI